MRLFRIIAAFATVSLFAQSLTLGASAQEITDPAPPQQTIADDYYRASSPEHGMVAHVFGEVTAERDLTLIQSAGFNWVKIQMPWRVMEPQKEVYDWTEADRIVDLARDHELNIIARIDGTPTWARADGALYPPGVTDGPPDSLDDYADFVNAFTGHFKKDSNRVHAVEIWNEPNIAREWGGAIPDPARYTQMLQLAYFAVKDASPRMTVLSGALTPTGTWDDTAQPDEVFLQGMYNAGAGGHFDVISVHAAGYKAPPEMGPTEVAADPALGGQRFFAFRHVEDIRGIMVANGDEAKQIWVTEFGWTSDQIHPEYAWHAVSEDEKADYLVRAFQYAHANWTPWVGVMTAWSVAAPYWTPDNEQYWWAVTNPDGTTRPAYDRLAQARATGMLP